MITFWQRPIHIFLVSLLSCASKTYNFKYHYAVDSVHFLFREDIIGELNAIRHKLNDVSHDKERVMETTRIQKVSKNDTCIGMYLLFA